VKIVNFKRRIESGPLTLRLCRLGDLRTLYSLFTPQIFPRMGSKSKSHSLFSFYRWMKHTFQVIYLIEPSENGDTRIVGFVGLYDMELGRRLSLSLTVFNPEDRRQGYGEKALTLLLSLFQQNGAAELVYVEILKSNVPSLQLCRKLGFEVKTHNQDRVLFILRLVPRLGHVSIRKVRTRFGLKEGECRGQEYRKTRPLPKHG